MASATADQVADAAGHIRNVLRTIQRVGNDWNAGVRAGAETELGKALTALGEQPVTAVDYSTPNHLRVDTDEDLVQRYGLNMTDNSFDPDVVYHVTYDGKPIQRVVSNDGQTNPIGFNDKKIAYYVRNWLRHELAEEYASDNEHTEAAAESIAAERIKVVKQTL